MQLGFMTAILPELSLEEVFAVAAANDYDCVEVMCWPPTRAERRYAGVTHLDVSRLDAAEVQRVQTLSDDTQVRISGLGYYPNPLSPDPVESQTAVAHLRRVIEGAATLGLEVVNTFIGRDWRASVDDNWPRMLEVWRPLVQLAESCNVRIGIENCPMYFGEDEWPGGKNLATSPAIWRRMFEDLGSASIGLNFDPSHFVWQMMDPAPALREFRDRLFHVHAKDARLDRDRLNDVGLLAHPAKFHTPKLPGLGDVNWAALISVLNDVGYTGAVCVEVEDRAFEGSLENRIASLRQCATYLRNYLPRRG